MGYLAAVCGPHIPARDYFHHKHFNAWHPFCSAWRQAENQFFQLIGANHLKRWDAKPLILLLKALGKQSCRAGPPVIATSGDASGDGTSVSCVPHGAGKSKLTEVFL
jgi:hypothetical protein